MLDAGVSAEYMRQARQIRYGIRMKDLELFGPMVLGAEIYFNNLFDEPSFRFSHALLSLQAIFYRNKDQINDFYLSSGAYAVYNDYYGRGKRLDYTVAITFVNMPDFFSKEAFFELGLGISGSRALDDYTHYLDEDPFMFIDLKAWHDVLLAKEPTEEEKAKKRADALALNKSWTGRELAAADEQDAVMFGTSCGIGAATGLFMAIAMGLSNNSMDDETTAITCSCIGAGTAMITFIIQEVFLKKDKMK
jgi:hypothetical protein